MVVRVWLSEAETFVATLVVVTNDTDFARVPPKIRDVIGNAIAIIRLIPIISQNLVEFLLYVYNQDQNEKKNARTIAVLLVFILILS